ncbi:MAG: type II toxin-antitoxin system VapC family toxin [Pseudonocardiaceae bacterium]
MRSSGVLPLPISHVHALHVANLPAHHNDPSDRLLIAQAQLDGTTLVTSDRVFRAYDVPVIWT